MNVNVVNEGNHNENNNNNINKYYSIDDEKEGRRENLRESQGCEKVNNAQ